MPKDMVLKIDDIRIPVRYITEYRKYNLQGRYWIIIMYLHGSTSSDSWQRAPNIFVETSDPDELLSRIDDFFTTVYS